MIFCKLDPSVLEEEEFGGPEVGKKERFSVKFLVNDKAGSIGIETFPPGKVTQWAFWHDETHIVLGGEAQIEYTLPPNHRKVLKKKCSTHDAYLILSGTRAKFTVTSKEPYLHAFVIMPRYQMEKWLREEQY